VSSEAPRSWPPRTIWRITEAQVPGATLYALDLELSVDTTAPAILEAIERAASHAGIELVRVGEAT